MSEMNLKTYNSVLKLVKEFNSKRRLTGEEFLDSKITCDVTCVEEDEACYFLLFVNHKEFLENVKKSLVVSQKFRRYDNNVLLMCLFWVVFVVNPENFDESLEIITNMKCAFKQMILLHFQQEDNLITMAVIGCKLFEDEYVLNNIVEPLLGKVEILKKLDHHLRESHVVPRKNPTVPDQLAVLQRKGKSPGVPLNTPRSFPSFYPTTIPNSLYLRSKIETELAKDFAKNHREAEKLLAEAQGLTPKYLKTVKNVVSIVDVGGFKAAKLPKSLPTEVKSNVAAILREANYCVKTQEKEIREIEEILKGGALLDKYRELETTTRKLEKQKFCEDIERKHLEGLLTYEEAILAKRKVIEDNKKKFRKFQEERENFLAQLEDWRKKEVEKIRNQVKKGHEIYENAKKSERKLREKRHQDAVTWKEQKSKLRQTCCERKQEELMKKIALIKEIRAMHQFERMQVKFDPKETANLGLLCEMSVADLQKKLADLREAMRKKLEMKHRCIMELHEKRRRMVENVKNFIAQARMSKPKSVPILKTDLEAKSPDLVRLRNRLEHARELRKSKEETQKNNHFAKYYQQFL